MRCIILLAIFLLSFSLVSADHPDHDHHHAEISIENVEVKLEGSSSKRISKGETLSKEAKPGDKVKVEFELVNEGDLEVEDIEVKAIVEDLDDGDDWEEDVSEFDLKSNRERSLDFSFEIPLEIGDGDYTVLIEVEGEGEGGEKVKETFEFAIEVEKSRDKLMLTRFDLSSGQVSCGGQVEISMGILNVGEDDQSGIVRLTNLHLNLDFKEEFFLDEGEFDADQKYDRMISFTVPSHTEPGTHIIDAFITYNGKEIHSQKQLIVQSCGYNKIISRDAVTQISSPPLADTTAQTILNQPPPKEETFFDSSFFIASIIAIQIILGVAGIALLVKVLRR